MMELQMLHNRMVIPNVWNTMLIEDSGMFYQWNRKKAWSATDDVSGWDSNVSTGYSLFLPAAGYCGRSGGTLHFVGSTGHYWSNTQYGSSDKEEAMPKCQPHPSGIFFEQNST